MDAPQLTTGDPVDPGNPASSPAVKVLRAGRLPIQTIAERIAADTGAELSLVTAKATAATPAEPEILQQLLAAEAAGGEDAPFAKQLGDLRKIVVSRQALELTWRNTEQLQGDLVEAVRHAYGELEGHFAFVVIHRDHPGMLVGARLQCPMVVGLADGEAFVASNAAAFLSETHSVQFPA